MSIVLDLFLFSSFSSSFFFFSFSYSLTTLSPPCVSFLPLISIVIPLLLSSVWLVSEKSNPSTWLGGSTEIVPPNSPSSILVTVGIISQLSNFLL
uniref:Uncharacterized protein n=1 Tax=Lutzomyia longipalpis TaxID=7200 RepID=A0A7G3B868_LUTLO